MSSTGAYARAVLAILKRDFLIFTSYRTRLFGQLVTVVASLALFFYVSRLVSTPQFPSPEDYFAFALVGVIFLRALVATFTGLATVMRQELVAGTFERMVTSPLGATAGTAALMVFPFALSLFLAIATVGVAATLFGASFEWSTVPLALPTAALVALSLAPFCLLIAASVILLKQATAGVRFFVLAIAVVAGFYFPVELLPGWIQWTADVQPFTPAIDLLRHLLLGTPLQAPVSDLVLKVAAFAVILLPLSVLAVRSAVEIGRRRATLIEY